MIIRNKNIVQSLRLLLLLIFTVYYSNISMFYHSHYVDGKVISHSHWYHDFDNAKPVDSHSHTAQEYILIHLLDNTSMDNDLAIPNVKQSISFSIEVKTAYKECFKHHYQLPYFQLRAPPAC